MLQNQRLTGGENAHGGAGICRKEHCFAEAAVGEGGNWMVMVLSMSFFLMFALLASIAIAKQLSSLFRLAMFGVFRFLFHCSMENTGSPLVGMIAHLNRRRARHLKAFRWNPCSTRTPPSLCWTWEARGRRSFAQSGGNTLKAPRG